MMSPSNREAFLADPNVAEMAGWVAARFDDSSGWTHTWVDRKNDNRWRCHGLRDAFLHYQWNGEAWAGTKRALDAFRCELREAVQTEDVNRVVTVCEHILRWGGVAPHNVPYLHQRQPVLVRELQHVRDLLSRNCTPSKRDLRREPDNPATECRMNAGFVKIYSLLCDDCVIYDGRVGAALGLLTRQFCEVTGRTVVPAMLAFAFGTPKEAPNTTNAKVRDPSHGTLRFSRLRPDARFHTVQVMRANWFVRRALERNPHAFSAGEAGFHELAAGLFMVGYDLRDA